MGFTWPFQADSKYYAYEATTNKIYQISQKVYECLRQGTEYEERIKEKFYRPPIKGFRFHLTPEEILYRLKHQMRGITLSTVEECNLRCTYCINSGIYPGVRQYGSKKMSWETAQKAIDFFLERAAEEENKIPMIGFYGGEPLLNYPLLQKTIAYVKNKSAREIGFTLTTNGTLLDQDNLGFFAENNVLLLVSLDGDKSIHDRHRVYKKDQRGTFDDVIRSIQLAKEKYPAYYEACIRLSVVAHPPVNLSKLNRFFSALGIQVMFSAVEAYGNQQLQSKPTKLEGMQVLAAVYKELAVNEVFNREKNNKEHKFVKTLFSQSLKAIHNRKIEDVADTEYPFTNFCVPGATKCFVSSQGDFYPCEKVESISKLHIGDIHKGFYKDRILAIVGEVTEIRNKYCTACWAFRLCRVCFYHFYDSSGFSRDRMTYFCKGIKNEIANSLQLYCSILDRNENALDFFGD